MQENNAEPSVYETPDIPIATELESAPPEYEYDSEYIVNDKIDLRASRSLFSGNTIHTDSTDIGNFRPCVSRQNTSYETKQEKIARLHREIEELSIGNDQVHESDRLSSMLNSATKNDVTIKNESSAEDLALKSSSYFPEKLSLLEGRVATLESRLGGAASTNLASTVEILQSKIDIIMSTPESLAQIKSKLHELIQYASKLDESEVKSNITELHQSLDKINNDLPTLALVIERLSTLQQVHKDAAEVYASCDYVRQSLTKRSTEIHAWQASLIKLESQIETGGNVLRTNTQVLSNIRDELNFVPQ